MKKYRNVVLFVLTTLFLASCYPPGTPGSEGLFAPYCIVEENVPFADLVRDNQWDRADKLEEDAYGREYFSYVTNSTMLGHGCKIEVHVICQVTGESRSYAYYQDIAYMIRLEDDPPFTDDEIMQLKEANDWGKPIVQEKLTYTSYKTCNNSVVSNQPFIEAVRKHLKLDESYVFQINAMRKLSDTAQIFFVCVHPDDISDIEQYRFFFVVYQSDFQYSIRQCVEMPYTLDCQETARTVRETWLYENE